MEVGSVCYALFVLIVVVECSQVNTEQEGPIPENERVAQDYNKWLPTLKQKQNCRMVCDGEIPDVPGKNVTKYPDGSWSYNLEIGTNHFLHIAYNNTLHFLAVFNPQLNIAWISNGIFVGIINVATDVLFLIDTSKNIASIFTKVTHLYLNGQINMMVSFAGLFDTVLSKSINMSANFAFKVDAFLQALQHHALATFFNGHINVLNTFKLNFGFYMSGSMKIDGFNTFLQPVIGAGNIGMELYGFLAGSISYGTEFSLNAIGSIFAGIGRISLKLQSMIDNTFQSIFDLGDKSWNALWNIGGSIGNIFSSRVQIEGGGKMRLQLGAYSKSGFSISFGNEKGNFSINYNASHNILGILNQELKFALVANGSAGSYLLVNITSGIGMIVNYNNSAKIIIDQIETVHKAFDANLEIDLPVRLSILAKILEDNAEVNVNNADVFNFKAYLKALFNGESVEPFFKDNPDMEAVISNNFGGILQIAKQIAANNKLFAKVGISITFNAIFVGNVIGDNFANLLNKIYSEKEGKFNAKIMKKVHSDFKASVLSGGKTFPKFIFGNIFKACFGGGGAVGGLVGHIGFGNNC